MENDNGSVILLTVLIVSALVLTVFKLAQFLNDFTHEKRYLLSEMHRAADYNEYRYWRRELRCHYLCLIPFVTERNVMKLYRIFFHRAKHAEKRSDGMLYMFAPLVFGIIVCTVCLCGASWAWYTASAKVDTANIHSAAFQLENVRLALNSGQEIVLTSDENEIYIAEALAPNTYTLSFQAAESSTSTKGYCCITVFENGEAAGTAYYTDDIGKDVYTITIKTSETVTVKIEPIWGDVKKRISENTDTVASDKTIAIGNAAQNNAQTPDNSVTDKMPTEFTAVPSNSSAESKTTEWE